MTSIFDPEKHGFLKLDYLIARGVTLYELVVEGLDQTSYDVMRLNVYLTQDENFVTVWSGLQILRLSFCNTGRYRSRAYDP